MKLAKSTDEIREHLAKGGKVLARNDDRNEEWEAIEFNGGYLTVDVNGVRLSCPVDRVKPEGWTLLPVEEKKVRQYYYYANPECRADYSTQTNCICWHDEGTGPLRNHPESISGWRDKPPGIDAKTLPLLKEDPTDTGRTQAGRRCGVMFQVRCGSAREFPTLELPGSSSTVKTLVQVNASAQLYCSAGIPTSQISSTGGKRQWARRSNTVSGALPAAVTGPIGRMEITV